jgi:hypothetical protein
MSEEAVALSPDAWAIIARELSRRSGKGIEVSQIRFARERPRRSNGSPTSSSIEKTWGTGARRSALTARISSSRFVAHDDTWALGGYSGPSSIERPQPSQPRAYLAGSHGVDGLNAGG